MLFEIGRSWECRACALDTARGGIVATDRRGDELYGRAAITRELDAQAALMLHLMAAPDAPPLPDDYSHVLAVLETAAIWFADEAAATIHELRERYRHAACFSPRQMLLVQWRLSQASIAHVPQKFVVSIRTDTERQQMWGMDDWRKKKLAPYLSWQQRSKFGF